MDDGDARYRPETGCAAQADLRHDSLTATAPPAQRWLLIESHTPWPRQALTALEHNLADVVARLCRELGIRPVLVRRYGRVDRTRGRRWGLVDCRPGREEVRWGPLPSDEHLLDVLAGKVSGTISTEPVYLVCTHGRHDACCAVRGRPVAAALASAYGERTWECSHIGGDRFAANVVVLPRGLFYGHVPASRAVELARQYDKGLVVPDLLRGSGAFTPPVQAAQHFAREAGHSPTVDNLLPQSVQQLPNHHYRILLNTTDPAVPSNAATIDPTAPSNPTPTGTTTPSNATPANPAAPSNTTYAGPVMPSKAASGGLIAVEVSAHLDTVDARLTCAGTSPTQVRRFELHSITTG